jgi:hypothetical protein
MYAALKNTIRAHQRVSTNGWVVPVGSGFAAGQLVTSEQGARGGPLAFNYVNLVPHDALCQSLADARSACLPLRFVVVEGVGHVTCS